MVRFVRNHAEDPGLILEVSRKSQVCFCAEILVFGPLFLAWVPDVTKFLLDPVWAFLGVLACKGALWRYGMRAKALWWWAVSGLGLLGAVYLTRYQRAAYFLWGVRNNFRFYAAFFGFALLTELEREEIWRKLEWLFWVNFFVALGQFFFFGLKGDLLGGLFGAEKGCNGGLNLFLVVMAARSLVLAGEGTEAAGRCLAKCGAAVLVAALAELKFFFVEFGVLLALAGSRGKKAAVFWAVPALFAGVLLMGKCFPEFAGWLRLSSIWQTASDPAGYASTGDLNRLNAVSGINERVFSSFWDRVFGLGLGNCEVSALNFLTTPFSKWYGHLHYSWMSHAFWYLEAGWLGLVFFFGFFCLVMAGRPGRFVRVLGALCLFIGIYNASLRTEAAFLVYFGLSERLRET